MAMNKHEGKKATYKQDTGNIDHIPKNMKICELRGQEKLKP